MSDPLKMKDFYVAMTRAMKKYMLFQIRTSSLLVKAKGHD